MSPVHPHWAQLPSQYSCPSTWNQSIRCCCSSASPKTGQTKNTARKTEHTVVKTHLPRLFKIGLMFNLSLWDYLKLSLLLLPRTSKPFFSFFTINIQVLILPRTHFGMRHKATALITDSLYRYHSSVLFPQPHIQEIIPPAKICHIFCVPPSPCLVLDDAK